MWLYQLCIKNYDTHHDAPIWWSESARLVCLREYHEGTDANRKLRKPCGEHLPSCQTSTVAPAPNCPAHPASSAAQTDRPRCLCPKQRCDGTLLNCVFVLNAGLSNEEYLAMNQVECRVQSRTGSLPCKDWLRPWGARAGEKLLEDVVYSRKSNNARYTEQSPAVPVPARSRFLKQGKAAVGSSACSGQLLRKSASDYRPSGTNQLLISGSGDHTTGRRGHSWSDFKQMEAGQPFGGPTAVSGGSSSESSEPEDDSSQKENEIPNQLSAPHQQTKHAQHQMNVKPLRDVEEQQDEAADSSLLSCQLVEKSNLESVQDELSREDTQTSTKGFEILTEQEMQTRRDKVTLPDDDQGDPFNEMLRELDDGNDAHEILIQKIRSDLEGLREQQSVDLQEQEHRDKQQADEAMIQLLGASILLEDLAKSDSSTHENYQNRNKTQGAKLAKSN